MTRGTKYHETGKETMTRRTIYHRHAGQKYHRHVGQNIIDT